jgi:peptide/nickel transport system substrate-binding protein
LVRRLLLTTVAALAVAPSAHAATATFGLPARPDYVDPALSYTLEGWSVLWAAYTPLLTYDHVEGEAGARLVPGLAESLPEVSADGRTYALRLREGLRYANGRRVRARDFEHAIRRVLRLRSGGSPFYLGIRGAARYLRRGRARGDIAGIATDDANRTIRIELTERDGTFANVLAMPFASLVPSTARFDDLTRRPPPGVGPFRIARSGRRGLVLRKAPRFAVPGLPQAAVDRIAVRYRARHGTVDLHLDAPPRRLRSTDRYREVSSLSSYYFFLDHRRPPFDRREVRQAANLAIDRAGMVRHFGGLFTPGCTFLPPGLPGHRDAPCPYGDPNGPPQLDRARQLVADAGATGARVNIYGNDEPLSRRTTRAFAAALRSIGLRPRLRIVDAAAYFTVVGNSRTRAHAGFANWFADFPHPYNFLFLLHGDLIQRANNQNLGHVDDAELDAIIDRIRSSSAADAAEPAAQADRRIVEEAHVVPYGHRRLGFLFSPRVPPQCRALHPLFEVDLARLCVA